LALGECGGADVIASAIPQLSNYSARIALLGECDNRPENYWAYSTRNFPANAPKRSSSGPPGKNFLQTGAKPF
jgi:hypothetical protein